VANASSRTLEDVKVGVRCKLAALWIATLLLFAYGDIFGFLRPGQLQEVMAGEASAIGETSAYYWLLSITERALLLLIVWYAWTWPRQEGTP
jgi:hypothetical protein